ncbi:WD40/YVTN/BNR-like repeat-containing protein [Variovorax sp. RT4R15]|uniref:WD40/YVTN/BNR-like repeat-containing protein n=1 Tax=Variovorax sp. RT4R15 TaxID=3443737 RepID=UPI003F45676D
MKNALATLVLTASLGLPGVCTAQAMQGTDAASVPLLAPALHVRHATQAMLLASTRAGARFVAVGDHGIVLLSDDGGKTHRQAGTVPVNVPLTSVSFVDERQGWAAGHAGVILHTTDGGENWIVQHSDVHQDRPLFGVHFFDAKHGVAVGLWSLVLTTNDGGVRWQTVPMPIPDGAKKADLNLLSLFADHRGRLFAAAEKGMVLRSDDQGQHWTYLATGYKGSFWTGIATGDGALLAAGLRGSLYRSEDDGRTWRRIETRTKSSITALATTGTQVVGVGLDGLELHSDDAGLTFATQVRPDRLPLTSLTLDDQRRPVLYSRQGVLTANAAGK